MEIFFNSTFQEIKRNTNDLWVKGNSGNILKAYIEGLDLTNVNINVRLVIQWSNKETTNELPMIKSFDKKSVYLPLPTLIESGETLFNLRIYTNDELMQTAIFSRVIKDSINASDDTNITSTEYEALVNHIEELNSNTAVNNARLEAVEFKVDKGIKTLDGVFTEADLINLFTDTEHYGDGKYSIVTEDYGDEVVIVNREKKLFKRFTAGYDYTYDFELNSWLVASGGGGGGGTGGSGIVYVTPITPLEQTIAVGTKLELKYKVNFSVGSSGTLYVYVNESLRKSMTIEEGERTLDVSEWVKQGTNNIRLVFNDAVGSSGTLIYNVEVIALKITSNFDDAKAYKGDIDFRFIPYGAVAKTVVFTIDGEEYATQEISETGVSKQQIFTGLSHGVHTLVVSMSATVNEKTLYANELTYNLIAVEEGNDNVIISSKFNKTEATEGELISIDYVVYNPLSEKASVDLLIDNVSQNVVEADRNKRYYWNTTNYSVGEAEEKDIIFSIISGEEEKAFNVLVKKAEVNITPISTNLQLELKANNKSNTSSDKDVWVDSKNNITATLTGFNYATNGWMSDENGYNVLRLNGKAKVEIPFKVFETDFLSYGKTIEIEFSTRDLININAEILSCYANDKGFKIFANKTILKSEQTEVSTNFKEEEKIKISFVIESKNENRLVKTFINGVLSGLKLYPADDSFTQTNAVNILIGSEECGIDIYNVRIYNGSLTDREVLNNYMADLHLSEQITLNTRNNILDDYGQVSYNKVKNLIPVIIVTGKMPSVKGDKQVVTVDYKNPFDSTYDFYYEGVIWDIQGTSSQYFPRKNNKGEFPEAFSFYENGIEENVYTFKADYMESSHSHNTGNAKIVNKYSPKFPTQETNPNVRNSIYGFPCLMFVREDENAELVYYGVYNFNNDKGNSNTIGLTTPNAESWEFKNNTSLRCNFLTDDFSSKVSDDFEARYPDKYINYTNLQRVVSWVYSTQFDLEKFKNEFEQYFNLDFCLFYYVMMDVFLAVDSRAKNMFLDTLDGKKWYPRWYDIDTTYGLNNEGGLQFSYGLEQTDEVENVAVYNGNNSVLWNNFGLAYKEEIEDYYNELRKVLTYDSMLEILQVEQIDKISENMYNTDAKFKYIDPLIEENDSTYLYVAQGSRLNHLQWWLNNRFKYLDSKYDGKDYLEDYITMRLYTPDTYAGVEPSGDFNITPYIDMYAQVKYGSSIVKERGKANEEILIASPENLSFQNTETIIYGASNILDLGDLSNKYARTMDFSKATKLKRLQIGSNATGYENTNLDELQIGNNKLLEYLDIRNCSNLKQTIDLSGCLNIKEIYATGTKIKGVTLAEGGYLETMSLPETIANLTITNQPNLKTLTLAGYNALKTLRLENVGQAKIGDILLNASNLEKVRVTNIDLTLENYQQSALTTLMKAKGIGIDGSDVDKAVLTGKVKIKGTVGTSAVARWNEYFGNDLVITADSISQSYTVTFINYDGTVLQISDVFEGGTVVYSGETPSNYTDEEGYENIFEGWDKSLENITENTVIKAVFVARKPTIYVLNLDDENYLTPSITIGCLTNISSSTWNGTIDWGDGEVTNTTGSKSYRHTFSHTYNSTGIYAIKILLENPEDKGTPSLVPYTTSSANKTYSSRLIEVVNIQPGHNHIYKSCFSGSPIENIEIPASITKIDLEAFLSCANLKTVTFEKNIKLTTIGASSFAQTPSLEKIEIPEGVTKIDNYAVWCNFTNVPKTPITIIIPTTVTTIGVSVFDRGSTTNKATVIFKGTTPPSIQSNTFVSSTLQEIRVPSSAVETYKTATNWNNFASYIVADPDEEV